jgi:uncharacterized membrane-anchored protein YhcB (DUF1043 family)
MVVEVVFGTILIILALCAGVGLPLLAVHFQQREVHERNLIAEVEQKQAVLEQKQAIVEEKEELVEEVVGKLETYHEITNIHPDDIPSRR